MNSRDLRLPPERFFWAVLDVPPQVRRRRISREQLGYLFEAVLPIPIDEVQADYMRLAPDGSRYLSCGMAANDLRSVREEVITLGPAALPEFLGIDADPMRINLLTGSFEPNEVKRLRRRWGAQCAAVVLILLTLLAVGHQWRVHDLHERAAAVHEARHTVYTEVLGAALDRAHPGGGAGGGQPPELMLLAELRQLRQTRPPTPPTSPPTSATTKGSHIAHQADATDLLAALLSQWPVRGDGTDALHAQVESISITSSAITIQAAMPSAEDVPSLAEALRPPEEIEGREERGSTGPAPSHASSMWGGWLLQQPQVVAQPTGVRATLRLTSRGEGRR